MYAWGGSVAFSPACPWQGREVKPPPCATVTSLSYDIVLGCAVIVSHALGVVKGFSPVGGAFAMWK